MTCILILSLPPKISSTVSVSAYNYVVLISIGYKLLLFLSGEEGGRGEGGSSKACFGGP